MGSSLSGGNTCLKYLVFVFNFLFFIIGCALLGIGIYVKVGKSDYIDVSEELTSVSKYVTAGNLMIAVGVIILIVAFLGCCGACMENQCMLLGFFILLLLIFILELAAGIFGIVYRGKIEDQMEKDFKDAILKKYKSNDPNSVIVKTIDQFQKKFDCCGYSNWLDWKNSDYFNATQQVPASCCRDGVQNCPTQVKPENYYQKGCFKEVKDFFKKNIYVVGACGIAFAVVQILGLIFSMLLYRAVRNSGTMA